MHLFDLVNIVPGPLGVKVFGIASVGTLIVVGVVLYLARRTTGRSAQKKRDQAARKSRRRGANRKTSRT